MVITSTHALIFLCTIFLLTNTIINPVINTISTNNNYISEYLPNIICVNPKNIYFIPLYVIKWYDPKFDLFILAKKWLDKILYKYWKIKNDDDVNKNINKNIISNIDVHILWIKSTVKKYFNSNAKKYAKYCKFPYNSITTKYNQNENKINI